LIIIRVTVGNIINKHPDYQTSIHIQMVLLAGNFQFISEASYGEGYSDKSRSVFAMSYLQ